MPIHTLIHNLVHMLATANCQMITVTLMNTAPPGGHV
jgi:hypothetical protein